MQNTEDNIQLGDTKLDLELIGDLRGYLMNQEKEWLVQQVISLMRRSGVTFETRRKQHQEAELERIGCLREIALDCDKLTVVLKRFESFNRTRLVEEGFLLPGAPAKGSELISSAFCSLDGNTLLAYSKDILYGLLYGDESTNTHFDRIEHELLTLTLPRHKAKVLNFMKAATELAAHGVWHDPDGVSNDEYTDNFVLEVEYGEIAGELIGNGIVRTLSLINSLEINEQVLYARMIDIEQSTLTIA